MSMDHTTVGALVEAGLAAIQTGPFGTQLRASEYTDEGVPVINVRNIGYGDLRNQKIEYVTEATAERLGAHRLSVNDIVFGRKGAVDRHLFVDQTQEGWVQGSDCIRLRINGSDIHPRYLSYVFLRERHKQWMLTQCGNKATMASLNQDVIKRIQFPLLPKAEQVRVADILSSYDELIANNQRRIVLLERSARLLFEEWFVRLHYPGHERNKLSDGLPEGWDKKHLVDICTSDDGIQTGPFGSQLHQSDYTDDGVPVVMPKDIISNTISLSSIARIPETLADKLGRHRLQEGDTVYGRRGDIGRRSYVGGPQVGFLCGTGCLRFRPERGLINPIYLFFMLGTSAVAGEIANRAQGSTMPNLSAGVLKTITIPIAPRFQQETFSDLYKSKFDLAALLTGQNFKLRMARDMLLSRLMDGRIAV